MKTGCTSTMEKGLFSLLRFALFLYRLKLGIFNQH